MANDLSSSQCILLAVHYASNEALDELSTLCSLRRDALPSTLVLRLLLTYSPESTAPARYSSLASQLVSGQLPDAPGDTTLDTSSIDHIPEAEARSRASTLHLLPLRSTGHPSDAPSDDLTLFLSHRANRIDQETGLIQLAAALVRPFATAEHPYLRGWFLSTLLPLVRLQYEYYPQADARLSIADFEALEPERGVDFLLSNATQTQHRLTSSTDSTGVISRDLRALVAPWLYCHASRKRPHTSSSAKERPTLSEGRRISLSGTTQKSLTDDEWEYVFRWLVNRAGSDFAMVTNAVEYWNGPSDVDFDDLASVRDYIEHEKLNKLDKRYAQAMFAACYVVDKDHRIAIDGAHGILVRLAELLAFEPPPELATSVAQLPLIDEHASVLHEAQSSKVLQADQLLGPEHPLTSPTLATYMLLQMFVYSAYQLDHMGYSVSIGHVARIRFFDNAEEQMSILQTILKGLVSRGKRDESQWMVDRSRLVWLWSWNIDPEHSDKDGAGMLGLIDREELEECILGAMLDTANHALVRRIYLNEVQGQTRLSQDRLEHVILTKAIARYDNASNGNRTRGDMKKAYDIIETFNPHFPQSRGMTAVSALIAATHALSFYSLTLQQGVPFQPATIRIASDPLSLVMTNLLEQNPRSYTKLDDLVSIGQNLVLSAVQLTRDMTGRSIVVDKSDAELAEEKKGAEQKVIYMGIDAALKEDDFDTAYSYLVNRLAPSLPDVLESTRNDSNQQDADENDMSWRAAFLAGRARPTSDTSTQSPQQALRRLEQRIELLSLALLLAPTEALSDILNVYRRCEEELTLMVQPQLEEDASSLVTSRSASRAPAPTAKSSMPGDAWADPRTEGMVFGQKTREMGRLASSLAGDRVASAAAAAGGGSRNASRGAAAASNTGGRPSSGVRADDEAQMGLFDVARGAAAAFSRNAFPLRNESTSPAAGPRPGPGSRRAGDQRSISGSRSGVEARGRTSEDGVDEHGRTRRRDVVASAVTGATGAVAGTLTSGLGWVLGATPVDQHRQDESGQ